jgi:predicted signal transduction protein with EAL and GGDEF domain
MKSADTAMYHAKAAGRNNFQFYAREMNEQATHFFALENRCARRSGPGNCCCTISR